MQALRKPLRIYILTTAIIAVLCVSLTTIATWEGWPESNGLLAVALAALIVVSHTMVLVLSPKVKVSVDTAFIFCALLLLRPPEAVLTTLVGIGLAEFLRHDPWFQVVFNASLSTLEIVAALAVVTLFGLSPSGIHFSDIWHLLVLLSAALAMHLVNSAGVAAAAGFQLGQNPLAIWLESWSDDILEQLALFLLGGLTVIAARQAPWTILLSVVPVAIVYVSLKNGLHLRNQTREAVEAMADVIDQRDPYTMGHSQRVSEYAEELALALGLEWNHVLQIKAAARVHDLGKIAIDGRTLSKNAPLSDAEWRLMQKHTLVAVHILERFPDFKAGVGYVKHHHENYDGTGYPSGLQGADIPIGARIIAVADAYDAMSTDRPYRRALSQVDLVAELRRGAGKQWDPEMVTAWIGVLGGERKRVVVPVQLPAT